MQNLLSVTEDRLVSSPQEFFKFLSTAAINYKYSFPDQILIHAQAPDSVACATADLWRDRFQRQVKDYEKSIKLLKPDGSIRNVFDITNTEPDSAYSTRKEPYLWRMEYHHKDAVQKALADAYDITSDYLEAQLTAISWLLSEEVAQKVAQNAGIEYSNNIESEDSQLSVFTCLHYYITHRCNMPCNIDGFKDPGMTKEKLLALGQAINSTGREVLNIIEGAVKHLDKERSQGHDRNGRTARNGEEGARSRNAGGVGYHADAVDRRSDQRSDGRDNEAHGSRSAGRDLRLGRADERGPEGATPGITGSGLEEEGVDLHKSLRRPDAVPLHGHERTAGRPGDIRPHAEEIPGRVESHDSSGAGRRISTPLSGNREGSHRDTEFHDVTGPGEQSSPRQAGRSRWLSPTHEDVGSRSESLRHEEHSVQLDLFSSLFSSTEKALEYTQIPAQDEISSTLEFDVTTENLKDSSTDDEDEAEKNLEKESISETKIFSESIDYRITDDNLGHGGAKAKYQRNVAAIKLLRDIEKTGRRATVEEQEKLASYTGWGGVPQVFDHRKEDWAKEHRELKELLTAEEYNAAQGSTLNAHYTAPVVIKAMYSALERMGFQQGNVLEPACGTGHFFGLLPSSMQDVKCHGVELDSITGRIARQLYQSAYIQVKGFEETTYPDNFFDVAIGNVPFGNYKIHDPKYNKEKFNIHDYFFAKALDQVRPGGVVAFVTSKGTMDKANPAVRKYLAQRAELLGAVRLPNDAFKANAGTEVTADIVFLQKRSHLVDDVEESWIKVWNNPVADGIPMNRYFMDNPHMVLGTMERDPSMYGNADSSTCVPHEGMNLEKALNDALRTIKGKIEPLEALEDLNDVVDADVASTPKRKKARAERKTEVADLTLKNYSFGVVGDRVYYRVDSIMYEPGGSETALARIRAMVGLRDTTRALLNAQLEGADDEAVATLQKSLNDRYDSFVKDFGRINDVANAKAFDDDASYYLLCGLEVLDDKGHFVGKSDIFSRRTIKAAQIPDRVESASEALILSVAQRATVDMDYMATLTGLDEEELATELQGQIFRLPDRVEPETGRAIYQTADAYLSGNVRTKLDTARIAAQRDVGLMTNVDALVAAQPKPLIATEIDVRLGATWIPPKHITQFIKELIQPMFCYQGGIEAQYSDITSTWKVAGGRFDAGSNAKAHSTYGSSRMNAYDIIESSLNLKTPRIYDIQNNGDKQVKVLNAKETAIVQQKQEDIKNAFQTWIFKDPERRAELVELYNRRFNSVRPREYDGSHLSFAGMNPDVTLKKHQKDAIARVIYNGNTLLAHEVGAGKTFEIVASAMEGKRMGLNSKSLFVVPNHLTEQMAIETVRLYPNANVLVTRKKDFETKNRKKFCARIATGDYDAIIMGHSQFEKIPISSKRQERFIKGQLHAVNEALAEIRDESGSAAFTVKQLAKTEKTLEVKLKKLLDSKKDDVVTFEELGIDRLYVDEAHAYKNLYLYTKMHNVAGISQSEAQKSSDMYMKCRYMDELTGGKGVIFATGTPVSNSMTELYTMQRYLQHDKLQEMGLENFDAWASTFGDTVTAIELAPEGTGYRSKTRFSKFYNLPELMNVFKEVADIKTADTLDLQRPDAIYKTVAVKPTEHQKELVKGLSERAAAVHNREVEPEEDNMLKITSDGRKIGLDQRLINPLFPDDPGTKVNVCCDNIYRIWEATQSERLTQLMFCDFSTPGKDKAFNVYDDIRDKLVAKGVPKEEIAYIHDADTEKKKEQLFAQVRSGAVRVLMGSTAKMGAGTNVQNRLVALHDLDCPWRPADFEQRAGRIVRQGNQNKEVQIYRYVTEGTFDAYLFQTIENKQKFIAQIMTSKTPLRSCQDVDESVLSYAEIKALCAGNPMIKEKMDLDVQVSKLKILEAGHRSEQYSLEDKLLRYYPDKIKGAEQRLALLEIDAVSAGKTDGNPFSITIGKNSFDDEHKKEAGEALLQELTKVTMKHGTYLGEYRGFEMTYKLDAVGHVALDLAGATHHHVSLSDSALGNLTRLENAVEAMLSKEPQQQKDYVANLEEQVAKVKAELGKPFSHADELQEKSQRLAELNILLDMEQEGPEKEAEAPEPEGKQQHSRRF